MANANGAQGGSDFSAQWIQYYRSMGMHREAEFIEQQAKQMKVCNITYWTNFFYMIVHLLKYIIYFYYLKYFLQIHKFLIVKWNIIY